MENIDNILLLMEETGCERKEAEFALLLANNNIEKAIVKLGIIQKHIIVFKIKMLFPEDNFYSLLDIAINTKTNEILRFNIVFSQNPSIYEISAETDWFSFEKAIFSARLKPGAMENYTKRIEEPLKKYIGHKLNKMSQMPDEEIIRAFFNPLKIKIEIISEQINATQFKKLPNFNIKSPRPYNQKQKSFIHLEVKVLESPDGKPIEEIKIGDTLMTLIIDKRDISQYVANLIGGKKDGQIAPAPTAVTKIFEENENYTLHFQYNDSISSYAKVQKGALVKTFAEDKEYSENVIDLQEEKVLKKPWWKKIL
jgi:hypothetical protein